MRPKTNKQLTRARRAVFTVFEVCNHFSHCNMSSMKRKRNVLTIESKLEIIKQLEKGVSGSSLAVRYNIGKATVSDIKKQKEAILQHAAKLDS